MKKILLTLLGVTLLASSCGKKAETIQKDKFQVFLCIGQSNMEGCAETEPSDFEATNRLFMLPSVDNPEKNRKYGEWCEASTPLSNPSAGLSPAESFGKTMVDNLPEDTKVGLISVAVGGCDIRLFDKDLYQGYTATHNQDWFLDKIENYKGNPYARLIELAKIAQKEGTISGIILHQGEQNTGDTLWPQYVKKVYENILSDLNLEAIDVPIIAGEVVPSEIGGRCGEMNSIIRTLPTVISNSFVVPGTRCEARADSIHYNRQGVNELGRRYAVAMLHCKGLNYTPSTTYPKRRVQGDDEKDLIIDIKEEFKKNPNTGKDIESKREAELEAQKAAILKSIKK